MRKSLIFCLLLVPMIILVTPVLAQDDGTNTEPSTELPETLFQNRFQWKLHGGYVAAGVGMRNTGGTGTITISGIPEVCTSIEAAYLYWDVLDYSITPDVHDSGIFAGTPITGDLIGSGTNPCWYGENFAFRADVTNLVTGNGNYYLEGFVTASPVLFEGASLIVVYRQSLSPFVTVTINDADTTNNAMYGGTSETTTFSGFNAAGTGAQITFVVADGQSAYEPDALFNGNPLGTYLFEGGDGPLWDTDTFDVSSWVNIGDTLANATVATGFPPGSGSSDCLVWIAAVLSVDEQPVGPIPLFSNAILMLPIAIIAGVHLVKRKRKTLE